MVEEQQFVVAGRDRDGVFKALVGSERSQSEAEAEAQRLRRANPQGEYRVFPLGEMEEIAHDEYELYLCPRA